MRPISVASRFSNVGVIKSKKNYLGFVLIVLRLSPSYFSVFTITQLEFCENYRKDTVLMCSINVVIWRVGYKKSEFNT
jgi:hypothetical protein